MKNRKLNTALYPFSLIYGLVVVIRNWLFDIGIIPSKSFNIPVISIGNLSVGGTGKTPHTEFILSELKDEWEMAVLSRGYKRKTKGFQLADEFSNSRKIGDEPYQIYLKFPECKVAVDEKRVSGVRKIQELFPDIQIVLLDDAFQHRQIQAGFSIILTDYNSLYTRDALLPVGRLRESKNGAKRADVVIVSKCPSTLKPIDMRLIETELNLEANQQLLFSSFEYNQIFPVFPELNIQNWTLNRLKIESGAILLVTGIASPEPIADYLQEFCSNIKTMYYPDHHVFQTSDFVKISNQIDAFATPENILMVTEKDAARLLSNPLFPETLKARTYALPIHVRILNNQKSLFIQKINNYVVENSRNR